MMYSCAPASRGSAAVVKTKRKKSLRVDIHCHYLNPDAAAKVASLNPAQHEAQIQFANALRREVNAKQMKDGGPKLCEIELRLKVVDRRGIGIQAASPWVSQS